jgi:hypothetical protein
MNGNTTLSARGADIGASKGLLIVNSAGNEGGNSWKYIITPSDADSVLCVGAVNTSGVIGSFSSYGPSADGQIKPDVASVGVSAMVQGTGNTIVTGNGTSFSCPNMAGLASCLWQGFPEFNNMRIIQTLRESGDRFANPDDRTGYGIPNMKTAFGKLVTAFATSSATLTNCSVNIQWMSKDIAAMRYEVERKAPGDASFVKVADINAKPGNILSTQSYQYSHVLSNVSAGIIQFRIRQLIDTAAASLTGIYVDTTSITLPSTCFTTGINTIPNRELKLSIAPNPTTHAQAAHLILESEDAMGLLQIEAVDEIGRSINKTTIQKRVGKQSFQLPHNNISAGNYWIRVYRNNQLIGVIQWVRL